MLSGRYSLKGKRRNDVGPLIFLIRLNLASCYSRELWRPLQDDLLATLARL